MLSVALAHVRTRARAEDVVQETWLAVLRGIDRFEGRSSFRTWLFRILVNRAKTHAGREARSVPLSALTGPADDGPAVDPDRFLPEGHRWAGHWAAPPASFAALPEERVAARETLAQIEAAIARLPERQREVITLRDVAGCTAPETCQALDLSEGNQRILLHRARSAVRRALEAHLLVPATD
jgi:RNA polymerase sigma-70 factor (ECF subfamily)